ncbi:MAG: hypothetical protein DKINENOH_02869 [bacterium]|nr:hypothetical protein [bacterium]
MKRKRWVEKAGKQECLNNLPTPACQWGIKRGGTDCAWLLELILDRFLVSQQTGVACQRARGVEHEVGNNLHNTLSRNRAQNRTFSLNCKPKLRAGEKTLGRRVRSAGCFLAPHCERQPRDRLLHQQQFDAAGLGLRPQLHKIDAGTEIAACFIAAVPHQALHSGILPVIHQRAHLLPV